jgi:membrane-associated phospholipid phosphatase
MAVSSGKGSTRPGLRRRAALTTVTLVTVLGHSTVAALGAQERSADPLFIPRDALIAAGFVLGTVAMFPLDRRIAEELQDPGTQANRFFRHASKGVEAIASPGAYYIGGSLWLIGRVARWDRVAQLGWHGTEAVLLAEGLGYVIKGAAGRARPFVSADTNPHAFSFGAGFSGGNHRSFPSGHTYTAFAAASAVTSQVKLWWPQSVWVVGPVMYGGASMVGLSRMYHNKHWASDVVLGAAIGTFSGLKVVKYTHDHPNNRLDRIMLRTSVAPNASGGMSLIWTAPW